MKYFCAALIVILAALCCAGIVTAVFPKADLTFADEVYGPEFLPLARVLKEMKLEPYIVSESDGTQAEDALAMKRMYEAL